MATVDQNREYIALAVTNNAATIPAALKVDPVTGYLLVDITVVTSTVPVLNTAETDANYTPTHQAVTDDANLTPRPLLIDNRNGYLYVDFA